VKFTRRDATETVKQSRRCHNAVGRRRSGCAEGYKSIGWAPSPVVRARQLADGDGRDGWAPTTGGGDGGDEAIGRHQPRLALRPGGPQGFSTRDSLQ